MIAIDFPQSNTTFGPPKDLAESQCNTIRAYVAKIDRGSCDGAMLCVTAWKPDTLELARLVSGNPIYLTVIGGLPPHFITTDFEKAIRPA